jgi:hypothetical protein
MIVVQLWMHFTWLNATHVPWRLNSIILHTSSTQLVMPCVDILNRGWNSKVKTIFALEIVTTNEVVTTIMLQFHNVTTHLNSNYIFHFFLTWPICCRKHVRDFPYNSFGPHLSLWPCQGCFVKLYHVYGGVVMHPQALWWTQLRVQRWK